MRHHRHRAASEAGGPAFAREEAFIKRKARFLGDGNRGLEDDLARAASVVLWDEDPSRLSPSERKHLRRTMITKMEQVWRTANRSRKQVYALDFEDEEYDEENDFAQLLRSESGFQEPT